MLCICEQKALNFESLKLHKMFIRKKKLVSKVLRSFNHHLNVINQLNLNCKSKRHSKCFQTDIIPNIFSKFVKILHGYTWLGKAKVISNTVTSLFFYRTFLSICGYLILYILYNLWENINYTWNKFSRCF